MEAGTWRSIAEMVSGILNYWMTEQEWKLVTFMTYSEREIIMLRKKGIKGELWPGSEHLGVRKPQV